MQNERLEQTGQYPGLGSEGCGTMPDLYPGDAFPIMQLLHHLHSVNVPSDVVSVARHNRYDLTNLILDLDMPGAVAVFSRFIDLFEPRVLSRIETVDFRSRYFHALLSVKSPGIMAFPQGEWTIMCPCSAHPRTVTFQMCEWQFAALERRQIFGRGFHEGLLKELVRASRGNTAFDVTAYKGIADGLGKLCFNLMQMPAPFMFTSKCQVCTWHMQQGERPAGESESNSNDLVLGSDSGRGTGPKGPIGKRHLSSTWELQVAPPMTMQPAPPGHEWMAQHQHQHQHQPQQQWNDVGYLPETFYQTAPPLPTGGWTDVHGNFHPAPIPPFVGNFVLHSSSSSSATGSFPGMF